jgi:hypothetical protein
MKRALEGRREAAAAFLAAPILRFQRVEFEEKNREASLLHMNPVKRGLVAHPKDWSWSSFSFYAQSEPVLIRIDPVR